VGVDGSDNHLVISNGGFVTNGLDGLIGVNSGAEANTVTLSGLGSRWVVNRFFEVGYSGDDNELLIENGASLVSGKATIGDLAASQGNQLRFWARGQPGQIYRPWRLGPQVREMHWSSPMGLVWFPVTGPLALWHQPAATGRGCSAPIRAG
jgi:T5SS/PEP-CTERM-associated repeat protein